MENKRPRRKAIPLKVKQAVCERQNWLCLCGCGNNVGTYQHKATTRFDHTPSIFLRVVNDAGTDYVPPQNDPDFIVARCLVSDGRKTHGGKRGTTAGSDINAIAKQRRRERAPKPKRKWPSRPMGKGRGFEKRKR